MIGPIGAAVVGWLAVQISGGHEAREHQRVLWLLEIGERLGDTPSGRGARRRAEREAALILERRGTRAWTVAWWVMVLGTGGVALLLGLGVLVAEGVAMKLATSATAAVYAGICAWAIRRLGEVRNLREEQRPTALVLLDDVGTSSGLTRPPRAGGRT